MEIPDSIVFIVSQRVSLVVYCLFVVFIVFRQHLYFEKDLRMSLAFSSFFCSTIETARTLAVYAETWTPRWLAAGVKFLHWSIGGTIGRHWLGLARIYAYLYIY